MKYKKEQKWHVVKHAPRAGGYIRLVVNAFGFNRVGDVLKVTEEFNGGALVKQKDHLPRQESFQVGPDYLWCYLPYQFEVVEPVETPEMSEEKYPTDVVPRAEVLEAIEEIEKEASSRLSRILARASQNPYFECSESDALSIVTSVLSELKKKFDR